MSLNPRNLVVVCINGQTMRNLATNGLEPGSVPVEGAFDLIGHLVSKCVGVDNVCIVFTGVDALERKQAVDVWLTEQKFFKGTGLSYRVRNIAYPSPTDGPRTMGAYVSEYLDRHHRHFLVISDCWSTFHGFQSDTKKSVTRVLLNPVPEEETKYVHSRGMYLLREWNDIRVLLPDLLRL